MVHEPHEKHERILHREEVFQIQGAVFEVNRILGAGFLEAIYQESLAIEFTERSIPFLAQPTLTVDYKGKRLQHIYVPDFICFGCVLVELKALTSIAPEHRAQVLNYLKAAKLKVGLLVNFGCAPKARVERLVM